MPFLCLQEEYSLRTSPSLWLSNQRREYSPSFCRYTTSRASSSWEWRWAVRRSSCMRISMGSPLLRITPFSVPLTLQMESKLTLFVYFFIFVKVFGLNRLNVWSSTIQYINFRSNLILMGLNIFVCVFVCVFWTSCSTVFINWPLNVFGLAMQFAFEFFLVDSLVHCVYYCYYFPSAYSFIYLCRYN